MVHSRQGNRQERTKRIRGVASCAVWPSVELAWQEQCERDGEMVRLASQERVQLRPHPERSSGRLGEQHEIFEVTKISSKDQILQRTGGQILKGFARDRGQQCLVEQSTVPEMTELLEEVPKMMSRNGIQRRTAEHIVDLPAAVLPERFSERICGHSGVIEVTKISSHDQNLQRKVEQILDDPVDESI